MEYHTHIICSKEIIRNTFAWELIFSASDMIQRCPTNPLVWTITGLCSFTLSRNLGIDCHPEPDAKILHTLEKIISDYYGCETIVNIQNQAYYITLSDTAHERVDLMNTTIFGHWPQNGAKPEPLEWIILEKTENEILLLCKYSIETKGFIFDFYNESHEYRNCLWEYSDLRHWLNEEFYQEAFDEYQKDVILTTEIKTMCNDTESLDVFENKVFLLSEEQVNLYLTTPELRKGIRTINAANASDVLVSDRGKQENIPWWILPHIERGNYSINTGKDKGKQFSYVAYPQMVFDQGIQYHGRNVYHKDWSVRPAIRLRRIDKGRTEGMKLMCAGKVVTKEQEQAAIDAYGQKKNSPEYQQEVAQFAQMLQKKKNDMSQHKRYEYRKLPMLDKIYKLDHMLCQAYTLNENHMWTPTINGVYQDLAHGHIGSEYVIFDDIYPMQS